jgi:hypothetical protein
MSALDDYLAGLPQEQREALVRVRAVVERVAPDAEEGVSYGMPAYLHAGRPLLGLRAATRCPSRSWWTSSGRGRKRSTRSGDGIGTEATARTATRPATPVAPRPR